VMSVNIDKEMGWRIHLTKLKECEYLLECCS
jgi:hypothetical protein